jgi:hydroxymethylglutaryl-CoA synthase
LSLSHNTSEEKIKENLGVLFIGSESHPYAVKPSGTVVAQALGFASDSFNNHLKPLVMADLQFACKAGTQAMQIAGLYIQGGFSKFAVAIGTDLAQAEKGDVLEYTAGAGSATFIMGTDKILAKLLATTSVATDTPDFWRRSQQPHPQHAGRFTAEPGYFNHITMAVKLILAETGLQPKDFKYCVFHTPNGKFPIMAAEKLGFTVGQVKRSLLVKKIGNTYAGSSLLGLARVLDVVGSNEKILVVSYGSGAGSDAFVFETTPHLVVARKKWSHEKN